jgi:hypothetical protein
MSTNYYMKTATSVEDDDGLHLGKRSGGWRFTFKGVKGKVVDYESWKDNVLALRKCGYKIFDEYGKEQHLPTFFRMVENWYPDGQSNFQWCKDNNPPLLNNNPPLLDNNPPLLDNSPPLLDNNWEDADGNSFCESEFC